MMQNKILIIGQALPIKPQDIPYDSTQLYKWLDAVGVSQQQAAELFEFDAMSAEFPGKTKAGGHKAPSTKAMKAHYMAVLHDKIMACSKIILLGNCPKGFFNKFGGLQGKPVLHLIHPSKRNVHLFNQSKETILSDLKNFIA